jgi:hypothetical protein
VRLLLFLTATLFLILAPLTGNAQSSSAVESLKGTSWEGSMDVVTSDHGYFLVKYAFTEDGEVKETTHYRVDGWTYEYDDVYHRQVLRYRPIISGGEDTVCKYKRDGDSIQFHCYEHGHERVWNATIQGNRMEGKVTLSQGTPQESSVKWSISRIGNENVNANTTNEGAAKSSRKPGLTLTEPQLDEWPSSDQNKFAAPSDSPLIGTWKFVEYSNSGYQSRNVRIPPRVKRSAIVVYLQSGVVEITMNVPPFPVATEKRNWKYIPKTPITGAEEDYLGDDLVERDNIRWLNTNQFEATVVFHQSPNLVGEKLVFTRVQ